MEKMAIEGKKAFNNEGSQETPLEIARKNFHNALGMLGERLGLSGEELEVFVRDAHTGMDEAAGITEENSSQYKDSPVKNLIQRALKR